ncbi:MAG: tyrosine-type recombinase/integrase [Candidatus Dormibacteria bacterium]
MTDFASAATDYLVTRRALGYQLSQQGQLLTQFVAYLDSVGASHLTVEHAVAWAKLPTATDPVWWNARLAVVRGFSRYMHALDPFTEVPPVGILPDRNHRVIPYIYDDDDLRRLLQAAGRLSSPLRADTYQTLIALLAVTGMRIGEAVRLDQIDLDWSQGLLTIRHSKYGKSRQLPLQPTTVDALRGYARRRDERRPRAKSPSFFVSTVGTRLIPRNAMAGFAQLVCDAKLDWSGRRRPPRLHDLRHAFAVRTVIGWYRDGLSVEERLPLLSTYLGHIGPASTYYYLTAVPELLALAIARLEADWDGGR